MKKNNQFIKFTIKGIPLIILLIMNLQIRAQQASALDYFIGTWNYSLKGSSPASGVFKATKGAGGAIHLDETYRPANGSPIEIAAIMGYDGTNKEFIWQRVWSNGRADQGRGLLNGNELVFVFDNVKPDGKASKSRIVMTMARPDYLTFRWEESIMSGPWKLTQEGESTKVK
jgi:hypothetical protein